MNIRIKTTATLLAAMLLAAPPAALAASHSAAGQPVPATPATTSDLTDGEVRKVDADNGKLTLKHGEIKSLDMPAMTMVFVVKDKAVLDKLKAGDKVRFRAVNDGGRYTVTEIAVAAR